MKTPEDEAFDELAQRQGMWGGGFDAKRQAAMDKLHWSDCAVHNGPAYPAGECDCGAAQGQEPVAECIDDGEGGVYYRTIRKHIGLLYTTPPLPVQEPVAEVVWGAKTDFEWEFKMLVELACVEDVPVKLYAGEFKGAAVYWHDTETDKGTTPPKREWVGLTPEETSGFTSHEMTVVKYVSKVLQEKNG